MSESANKKVQHTAEVRLPANLWKRLRIAGIEHNTNASELMRRGARLALQYLEDNGELPPARPPRGS
jgi:hypothetical protein